MTDREARIRELAHQIWQDEGRPEGRDEDHWRRAEEQLGPGNHGAGDAATENWKVEAGLTEAEQPPVWPTAITPD